MSLSDRIAARLAAKKTLSGMVSSQIAPFSDVNPALRVALNEMVSRLSRDRMFLQAFGIPPNVGVLDINYTALRGLPEMSGYFIGVNNWDESTLMLVDLIDSGRVKVTVVPRSFGSEYARATGVWVETSGPVTTEIDATADNPEKIAFLTERLLARHVADVVMKGGYSLDRPRSSVLHRLGIARFSDQGENTAFTQMVAREVHSLEEKLEIANRTAAVAARKAEIDRDAFLRECPGFSDELTQLAHEIQASEETLEWIGDTARLGIDMVIVPSGQRDGSGKFLIVPTRVGTLEESCGWIEVGVDISGHVEVTVGNPFDAKRNHFVIQDGARSPVMVLEAIEIAIANYVSESAVRYS